MKKILNIFLVIILGFLLSHSCETDDLHDLTQRESSIEMVMKSIPAEVSQLNGVLSRDGFDTINFDFDIKDNSATAYVEGISVGKWVIEVYALDTDGITIYYGSTTVEIKIGETTIVKMELTATGSIEVIVTWEDGYVDIPDEHFLKALIEEGVDKNDDGKISIDEALDQHLLRVGGSDISNLKGIEAFTNLNTLWIRQTRATEIDISTLLELREIMFDGNQLTSLDVTNNTALRRLSCDNNKITGLDVTNNHQLVDLYCHDNQIPELDVRNIPNLRVLHFRSNKISTIDVSQNPEITHLNCGGNKLTTLDLSCKNALYLLSVHNMPSLEYVCLPKRDVSIEGANANTVFTRDCGSPCDDEPSAEFHIPDIAFLHALIAEGVDTNNDNHISIEEAEAVTHLNLNTKGITDMTGIEAFMNLERLECIFNSMTSLDLSKNTALTRLNCYTNPLKSLNVSNCTELKYLQCNMNQLNALDVSDNAALEFLDCQGNNIEKLDVSNNTLLENLRCGGNQLTSLDVSSLQNLIKLVCHENKLNSLDVSNNLSLQNLCCARNDINTLDLSSNIALNTISIWDMPKLTTICVWTLPFPPSGVAVHDSGSPNITYTVDCS